MSEIKRYDLNDYDELYEQKHGELCYYEDVKALEARIKELNEAITKIWCCYSDDVIPQDLDNLLALITDTKEPDNQDDS